MSLGGELMEEMCDGWIRGFLQKLKQIEERAGYYGSTESIMWSVIDEYKEHFNIKDKEDGTS